MLYVPLRGSKLPLGAFLIGKIVSYTMRGVQRVSFRSLSDELSSEVAVQ